MDINGSIKKFRTGLHEMEIDLTENQINLFLQYYD